MKPQIFFFAMAILVLNLTTVQHLQAQDNASYNLNSVPINGTGNSAFGVNALFSNTTGSFNTASGSSALFSNTTGFDNTASGRSALFSNTTGFFNTASGRAALFSNTTGFFNTASGRSALALNTTGSENTASGGGALFSNTTGSENTASGRSALSLNTIGSFNTATGIRALRGNTTGNYNTASGFNALLSNTTGAYNTATGISALGLNTTGEYNTTSGVYAMFSNTTGSYNNAHGAGALQDNTTGEYNTASGFGALRHSKTGLLNTSIGFFSGRGTNSSNSTFLGSFATASGDFTNATAIGYGAMVTDDNQVRIGNTDVTSIGGGVDWTTLSDGRYKNNIEEDVPGLSFITKLRPLTYTLDIESIDNKVKASLPKVSGEVNSAAMKSIALPQPSAEERKAKTEKAKIKYTGFVAQEVEKAAKELNYDFSGVDAPKTKEGFYGLRYSEFVVPLVKAVQELSKNNEEQQKQIDAQQQQISELKELVKKLINGITSNHLNSTALNLSSGYLEQNAPNPYNITSVVRYHLPGSTQGGAKLVITNMQGQVVKTAALNGSGDGQITLEAGLLAAGSYTYTLWIKDRPVDTKQMLIKK